MEQYATFFMGVAILVGFLLGRACTVWEFNEQRKARARIRRALRSAR